MPDFNDKMHQNRFWLGFRPRPRWGAYSAPSDPLAGFKGPTSKRREGRGARPVCLLVLTILATGLNVYSVFTRRATATKNGMITRGEWGILRSHLRPHPKRRRGRSVPTFQVQIRNAHIPQTSAKLDFSRQFEVH